MMIHLYHDSITNQRLETYQYRIDLECLYGNKWRKS